MTDEEHIVTGESNDEAIEERLTFLKKKRTAVRGKITRAINRVKESISTSSGTKRRLLKELDDIRSDYEKACEYHGEMYLYITDTDRLDTWENDLVKDMHEIEEATDDYLLKLPAEEDPVEEATKKTKGSKHLVKKTPATSTPSTSTPRSGPSPSTGSGSQEQDRTENPVNDPFDKWINDLVEFKETRVTSASEISIGEALLKLEASRDVPQISLKKFSGNPLEYVDFVERFKIHIHDKAHLSDDQRLIQLKMHLCGDAERSISGLGASGTMYATALKTIQEQFGQVTSVARAVINRLTKSQKIPPNNRNALRDLSIDLVNSIATLKRLNSFADVNANDNLRKIVSRLPHYLIDKWRYKVADLRERGHVPTVVNISDFVRRQVKAEFDPDFGDLERGRNDTKNDTRPNGNTRDNRRADNVVPEHVNTGRRTAYAQQPVNRVRTCHVCSQDHRVSDCPAFIGCSVAERVEHVKDKRLCFSCLNRGHVSRDCRSKKTCDENGCTRTHHKLLHTDPPTASSVTPVLDYDSMLPVVRVAFRAPNGRIRVGNVLIDGGAGTTVIRKDFARSLGLQGKRERIDIAVVGCKTLEQPESRRLNFWISSPTGGEEFHVEAYEIENTVLNVPPLDREWLNTFPYLHGIDFSQKAGPIDLILGVQYSHLHAEDEVLQGLPFEPVAKKTKLGWMVIGSDNNRRLLPLCSVNFVEKVDLERLYDLETLGVQAPNCQCPKEILSSEDVKVMNMFEQTCKKRGDRFEIGLPWKEDPSTLPNNYVVAERRLHALERNLMKDEQKAELYKKAMNEYVEKEWAEPLTDDELAQKQKGVYYLPHHGIYRADKKSTPLRVVFDPACHFNGVSLNSYLHKGPCLIGNLLGVLLRFREEEVAFVGDISKMFLQIYLSETDTHVHRFLWRDMDVSRDPTTYRLLRVAFGDKPSPDMASYVMLHLAKENRDKFAGAAEILERDRYMDDLIHSCGTAELAVKKIKDLDAILATGSFRIKEWYSSSQAVLEELNPADPESSGKSEKSLGQDIKTLGIRWDPVADTFHLCTKDIEMKGFTKRNVLARMSMLYDPLGLAAAVTIRARIALQQIWRMNLEWDDPLPENMCVLWQNLFEDIRTLSESVEFPRCLKPVDVTGDSELHVFADASSRAYGAVAYLLWPTSSAPAVQLVSAKARVAPLHQSTIPRLELMGALIASRLAKTIVDEFKIKPSRVTLWTDSQVVLHWINSDSITYKQFVGVRVAEIQSLWSSINWRYVPTGQNPADDLSRGIRVEDVNGRWIHGPEFLRLPEQEWPMKKESDMTDDVTSEKKKMKVVGSVRVCEPVIDPERFSSWQRLLRVTAYCLMFIHKLRVRVEKNGQIEDCDMMLLPDKVKKAEQFWLKIAQSSLGDWKNDCVDLAPFEDRGLIRVGGRLRKSTLQYDQVHPVLLPAGHRVSKLIMDDVHHSMGHVGPERTLCESRRKYWIVRGRNLAKCIVRSCVVCRKLRQPAHSTLMGDLPPERVMPFTAAFMVTGVDLFGPFMLKYGRNKSVKAWGAVFTCANVRAIHLEIVADLSTQAFLQALRRFAAHHGWPQTLISDNGSSFIGANRELKALVVEGRKQLQDFAVLHKVKWMFTTPLSPHQGGLYESLVKQTKRSLQVAIGQQLLTWNEMSTVFAEVECLINSRPLGHMTNDPNDPQPLTPNHFLLGRATADIPQGPFRETKDLHKRFEFVQMLVSQFWRRFVREYFPTLMRRSKWRLKGRQLRNGDIVLLVDFTLPRGKWHLGRIVETFPGQDGVVRNVKVKTKNGEYQRSIQKCCVILENDEQ